MWCVDFFNESELNPIVVSMVTFSGFSSSDDWAEQKYLESLGRREVYDYGKELPTERVLLTSTWAMAVTLLLGRVVWQVRLSNDKLAESP